MTIPIILENRTLSEPAYNRIAALRAAVWIDQSLADDEHVVRLYRKAKRDFRAAFWVA